MILTKLTQSHWPKFYYFFFGLIILFRILYSAFFVSFGQDVARDAYIAGQNIQSRNFIVAYGPKASVWNFYLPPFYYQLHLVVSLITDQDPLAMKWFITIVESLTPILLFVFLTKLVKPATALLASSFYAFSPLVIFYATNAWNPNMIPFLSLLLLWSLVTHFQTKKGRFVVLGVVCFGLIIHLHYQSFVLVPFMFMAFIKSIWTKKQNFKYWLIGVMIFLATLLPYGLAEWQYQLVNTKQIQQFFSLEHKNYYDRITKPEFMTDFVPGYFERTLRGIHTDYWLGRFIILSGGIILLWSLLYTKNKTAGWVMIYFISILVMLRVYKGDKPDYYLSTLIFVPFIFTALIIDRIKILAVIILFLIMIYSARIFDKQASFNELTDLKTKIQVIKPIIGTGPVSLLFHDDDMINQYAYGFNYLSDLTIDQTSHTLLEICPPHLFCAYDGHNWCKPSREYMYVAYLKRRFAFSQKVFQVGEQIFVLNQFDTAEIDSLLPPTQSSGYGSDFIFQNATINPQDFRW